MCLDKLKDFEVTQKHGWQVFMKRAEGYLYSRFFNHDTPIPIGKWQRDKFRIFNKWIYMEDYSKKYKKGFHIFLSEEDAQAYGPNSTTYCVKKVGFKRVVAKGFQTIYNGGKMAKVVVCHKRFIEQD